MAAVEDDFESWLSLKLQELNTDEGVFGNYIKGILDGDDSVDEKTEALEGILTEITVSINYYMVASKPFSGSLS